MIHYVNKAIRIIGDDTVALSAIDTPAVRLMIDAVDSSAFERREVFDALNRFMDWCEKRGLIPANPCDGIDRDDRPRHGPFTRSHAADRDASGACGMRSKTLPTHVRDLIRFLLLVPLRREEAQGLLWSEVNLAEKAHRHSRRADEKPAAAQLAAVRGSDRHSCRARFMPWPARSCVCAAVRRKNHQLDLVGVAHSRGAGRG